MLLSCESVAHGKELELVLVISQPVVLFESNQGLWLREFKTEKRTEILLRKW